MTNAQLILSIGIPSILVVLSWIHNNSRLGRLETGLDQTNRRMEELSDLSHRRMDDLQKSLHGDMLSFQAAVLGEISLIRERMAVVEARR